VIVDLCDGWMLTTDHAASSYGVPVLVKDGEAYGPADRLPSGELAGLLVKRRGIALYPAAGDDRELCLRFIRGV